MKLKLIVLIIVSFLFVDIVISQSYDWIIPNKVYLKMYAASDGMVRIDRADFTGAGINTSIIDPRTVKVYNKGVQIPIYFKGQIDGVFNDNDYIDFYAQRNYGGRVNTYDQNNTIAYVTDEYFNQYSDTNIYWIGWDGSAGIRYDSSVYSVSALYPDNFYSDKMHFERDQLYSLGENASASDYRFLSNEKFKGEGWYRQLLNNGQSATDTFNLPLLSPNIQNVSLKLFAYPMNSSSSIFNEHKLEISINGTLVITIFTNDFNKIDSTVYFSSSLLSGSSSNVVEIKYVSESGFSGSMYFDYFEIQYPKVFRLSNDKISWNLNSTDTSSRKFKVTGYNSANPVFIYDIKNNLRITNFSFSADTLIFTAKGNSQIEIVNNTIIKKPFRIKQKSVPDLISGSNGADYILVYHDLFANQAEQLRAYRESADNYRSVKAKTEDLFDIFNYGIEDPSAVKRFIKYAYDNWQLPKLKFVCLFGRGSLDPKKNLSSSVYYNNFVPTYGNPNSDGYFVHLNEGGFYYSTDIAVGRIPVTQTAEAQSVVNKIISYESQQPESWWKNFTFITGGGTYSEQQSHQLRSNYEVNTFVLLPSISGMATKIYRTDTSGTLTYNVADSVKNVFNRGTFFVNFRGHAGSHDWEVIMNDPNTLNNGSRLPVILSLTCFTGENARADFRGFGEEMYYLENKGAIGFISTTGWSFGNSGNDLGTYIIQNIKRDSSRRIGDFMSEAGLRMKSDSGSFSVRHTINCYSLIGDPASKLLLPEYPEFVISQSDYKLSNETPLKNEPVTLTIFPKNFGLYADSCKIRFKLRKNNQDYSIKDTVYRAFKYLDTVKYNFKLDSSGIYDMTVSLDIDNRFPFEIENNNSITINIPSKDNTFITIKPVDNSIVYSDSINFSGLNPNFHYGAVPVKVLLKFDTTANFNSPLLRTLVNNNAASPVTSFKTLLPLLKNNTIYYWTTASVVNNDTSGWSKVQSIIYNNGALTGNPQMRYINSLQNVNLLKLKPGQYSESEFFNTGFVNGEIKLTEKLTRLFVRSYGSNAEEASYFSVGNKNIFIDAGLNSGLNMLKVSRLTGDIYHFKNFKVNNAASSDSIIAFLNTFDTTHILMLLNASYDPGTSTLTAAAKAKIRQFGSVYCDSIHLVGYFHTWSFIGFLGAEHSEVSEMFDPCCRTSPTCTACSHWTQSVSSMDLKFKQPSGTVSYHIGPASAWTDFSWTQTLPPGGRISFDVYGIDVNNNYNLIYAGLVNNSFSDIGQINPGIYPNLLLLAKLEIDTLTGFESPSLKSVKINYSPANELVLDANSFSINTSQKSSASVFSFDCLNPGYSYIYGSVINVFRIQNNDSNLLFTDTVNKTLETDASLNYSGSFTMPSFQDSTRLSFHVKGKDGNNEFYYYNNFVEFTQKKVGNPKINPSIEVYADGNKISSGDEVRKNPELKINLTGIEIDNNISDTSSVMFRINQYSIPYFIGGKINPKLTAVINNDKGMKVLPEFVLYPDLNSGKNNFSIIIKTEADVYDTVNYDLNVAEGISVSEIYNYPNPMKSETDFVFSLSGSVIPGKVKIKVYTVSGRLIRTLEILPAIGTNQIKWDGKDNDGDYLANGTYLYKLVIEESDFKETQIQKLVILK